MEPQRTSTAQSGAPGALWWREPGRVYLTQWDALVRQFQVVARANVTSLYAFPDNGDCRSVARTIYAGVYSSGQLLVTGTWDLPTAIALGSLLCRAGLSEYAATLAGDIRSRSITAPTVKALIAMSLHLQSISDTVTDPSVTFDVHPEEIDLPTGFVLPQWDRVVQSDPRDSVWVGSYDPSSSQPPPAPSQRSAPQPPQNTGIAQSGDGMLATTPFGRYAIATAAFVGVAAVAITVAVVATRKKKR